MRKQVAMGKGIHGLVAAFEDGAAALKSRLADLRAEMAVIERALNSVIHANGVPVRRGPGRPPKTLSSAMPMTGMRRPKRGGGRRPAGEDLASMMVSAMQATGKPMRVGEIADAVKKNGYSSSSPAFKKIVAMRLLDRKKFKRAGRGLYTAPK